jgi:predicted RND superfamily exporter protein
MVEEEDNSNNNTLYILIVVIVIIIFILLFTKIGRSILELIKDIFSSIFFTKY